MSNKMSEQEFLNEVEKSKRKFYKKYFSKNKNIDDVILSLTKKVFINLGKGVVFVNNFASALEKLETLKIDKEKEKISFYVQVYNKVYYLMDMAIQEFELIIEKIQEKS